MKMPSKQRQLTIKGAFRKKAQQVVPDDECDELEREIEEVRAQLVRRQNEIFEAERLTLRDSRPAAPVSISTDTEPRSIVYESKKQDLERQLRLLTTVTGVEVAAYERGQQCCVIFHMQLDHPCPLQHGLRIDMSSGTNAVTKYSLPLGFNFEAVMSEHDNVMNPDCLAAFRRSLVAYYNRQKQYQLLQELVKYEVQLFRVPDTTHVELQLKVRRRGGAAEGAVHGLSLHLDYRVYDLYAKQTTLIADMNEDDMRILSKQCSVFKKKAMDEAFKECFMDGLNPWEFYMCKEEVLPASVEPYVKEAKQRKEVSRRAKVVAGSDDETWLPEDDHIGHRTK